MLTDEKLREALEDELRRANLDLAVREFGEPRLYNAVKVTLSRVRDAAFREAAGVASKASHQYWNTALSLHETGTDNVTIYLHEQASAAVEAAANAILALIPQEKVEK